MKLLLFAVAFIAGVLLAERYDLPSPALGLFVFASLLLAALLVGARHSPLPALFAIVLLLGALRVEAFESGDPPALTAYHGAGPMQARGTVIDAPERAGTATRLRLRVDGLRPHDEWIDLSGDALVTLRESSGLVALRNRPYFRYGDRLLLEGVLETPPPLEDFDYAAYLARQGVHSVMYFPSAALLEEGRGSPFYRWLHGLRLSLANSLDMSVPEPQASMGQALLLGLRDGLPDELVEDFRKTGTSHVLAISGLHVGILLGTSLAASAWLLGRRRHLYLLTPFTLLWLYALLAGMSPSVTRAAIMGSMLLAAMLLGRPRSALPALGFAAAVMVAINPNILWSVSFQLSFAAVAGIALLMPRFSEYVWAGPMTAHGLTGWLVTTAAMSIAATIAIVPLLAFHFERVSFVGIFATLLVMPTLPLTLVAHAVTAMLGLAGPWAAQLTGLIAWVTSAYLIGVVRLIARLPVTAVEIGWVAPYMVWAYYGALMLFVTRKGLRRGAIRIRVAVRGWQPISLGERNISWWAIAPVVSVAGLLWATALLRPDSRLQVAFVDVGQGDGAYISTPGNRQIVVDGGPDPLEMVRFLGENMPFRDRSIDLVVLSHAHSDHVNGLIEVLSRYEVRAVLERRVEYESSHYTAWRKAVAEEGAELVEAEPGQRIDMGDGVVVEVLGPPSTLLRGTESDVDNASVGLRLVYGEVSFLLTGDMFSEAESALLDGETPIDADVLKVGHHGSRTSSSPAFIDAVSPTIAVVSAGADNRFNHPHPETIETLTRYVQQQMILQTSERGTIRFYTDGQGLWIKTER